MKYKKYFRKTSFKQKEVGSFFLKQIEKISPKIFLEVGVFHGVTARNVCELLNKIHGDDFKYIGIDLFEESLENKNEIEIYLEKLNKNLSSVEKVKKFKLIDDEFTIENGMLTPTLKLKRKKILEKFKENLEELY